MDPAFEEVLECALSGDVHECADDCMCIVDLLERANLKITHASYASNEEYYAQALPPALLGFYRDTQCQADLAARILNHVLTRRDRYDLIWVLGKARADVSLEPLARFIHAIGDVYDANLHHQAVVALSNFAWDRRAVRALTALPDFSPLHMSLTTFVLRSIEKPFNEVRENAACVRHCFARCGIDMGIDQSVFENTVDEWSEGSH